MIDEGRHYNSKPDMVFETIDDLRSEMTRLNAGGDSFLDYLITGQYSEGKGVWVNDGRAARQFYNALLEVNPHLACESPFGA